MRGAAGEGVERPQADSGVLEMAEGLGPFTRPVAGLDVEVIDQLDRVRHVTFLLFGTSP